MEAPQLFLSKNNTRLLSETLGISESLVEKFARKWHILESYDEDQLIRPAAASMSDELRRLNAMFIKEYSKIREQRQSWEENQLKTRLYGYWKDQQPNRKPVSFYGNGILNRSKRHNRHNQFAPAAYETQYTEYGNVLYREKSVTKSRDELARGPYNNRGRYQYADAEEIYRRCKNGRS